MKVSRKCESISLVPFTLYLVPCSSKLICKGGILTNSPLSRAIC
jgi:hypothetical protein